jgi:hypothetical protein
MKFYILLNEASRGIDFNIIKVDDHLVIEFEKDHPNDVLAMGNDLQEAMNALENKEFLFESIKLGDHVV